MPRVPTVRQFATEFLDVYALANNKPSEVQSKRTIFRAHLLPVFGGLKLDEVDRRRIEHFKAAQLAGGPRRPKLAPKTVNNHLTVLSRMLQLAVEWEVIDQAPPVKWLRVPEPAFDFLTFDEARALLRAAGERWYAPILIGLRTGLRRGELIALRWVDVDLAGGKLHVQRSCVRGIIGTPKSGRPREVPLSELARLELAGLERRGETVFADRAGAMLTPGAMKWPLWHACEAAGLRRIGWHVLRHTFASHLVMRGASLKSVQELLGHATIDVTMRYAHVAPTVNRAAVAALDE